jgi:transposase InsO family protein
MIGFIDDHRGVYGVEPICKILPIAPSTYRAQAARRRDPGRLPARARRDAALMPEIARVFEEDFRVYGVRKVWRQLKREGHDLAPCTVARLMRSMGLQGVIRGKPVRTTISGKAAPSRWTTSTGSSRRRARTRYGSPTSPMSRPGRASPTSPSSSTPMRDGSSAGACRGPRIRASCWMRGNRPCTSGARCIAAASCITATGGSQYVSIHYTERLAQAGIEPSVGSVGDSYDNALAGSINGLYKAEVIHRRGPWRSLEAVEFATLEWVDWFNYRRLLEPIGNIPPAEAEALYYAVQENLLLTA